MNDCSINRREAAAIMAGSLLPGSTFAADAYPTRAVTMVVPFAAGNVTDGISRMLAERLSRALGQPVVVENKPGASGAIGMVAIGRASADGHTIGMSSIGPMALNPALYSNLPYDAASFSILSVVFRSPFLILVNPSSPWRTLRDLVQAAQHQSIDFASAGTASAQHLTGELFKHVTKSRLTHVPNKGSGQAATLLLGKHVPLLFENTGVGATYVMQNQMRALAITSPQRLPSLPNVPTVAEQGYPGFATEGFGCVIAPGAIPTAVRQRLSDEIRRVMSLPDMQAAIAKTGAFAESMSSEESTTYVQAEIKRWGELIRSTGIKLD